MARWLPVTILPHQDTLDCEEQFLIVFSGSPLTNLNIHTNVSMLFSRTACSLKNMYTLIQKENIRPLPAGHEVTFRKLFATYVPRAPRMASQPPNRQFSGSFCAASPQHCETCPHVLCGLSSTRPSYLASFNWYSGNWNLCGLFLSECARCDHMVAKQAGAALSVCSSDSRELNAPCA